MPGFPSYRASTHVLRQWSMWYNWNIFEVFLQLPVATEACGEHTVHIISSHLWIHVVPKATWCETASCSSWGRVPAFNKCTWTHANQSLFTFYNFWLLKTKGIIAGRLWRNCFPLTQIHPNDSVLTLAVSLAPAVGQGREYEDKNWENSWVDIKRIVGRNENQTSNIRAVTHCLPQAN